MAYNIYVVGAFLICCLRFHVAQGIRYEVNLSSNYSLTWEIVDDYIDFVVRAKTPGWVGLALNYRPRMNGADMVIGGVDNSKSSYIYSFKGEGNTLTPTQQSESNWQQGSQIFSETEQETVVSFRRILKSGKADEVAIENKDLYLLWAYGADDNVRRKHVANGSFLVNLVSPDLKKTTAN